MFRGVRGFVTLKPIFYALQLLTGPVEINDAVKFQEKFKKNIAAPGLSLHPSLNQYDYIPC